MHRNEGDLDKKDLLAKGLEINPNFVNAWIEIANELDGSLFPKVFISGGYVTLQDCYKRIISLGTAKTKATAYIKLGETLSGRQTTTLQDGTVVTREQLFARASALKANT